MFWFADSDRDISRDWRPEVHDSDGLAIWNGAGERIWRPLNNPTRISTPASRPDPQRLRPAPARPRLRPLSTTASATTAAPTWVEPLGDWGKGVVQLVEIPTDDEIHDNIAAYWLPRQPAKAGDSLNFHYRLHWVADQPYPASSWRTWWRPGWARGQPGKPRPKGGVEVRRSSSRAARSMALPLGVTAGAGDLGQRGTISTVRGTGSRQRPLRRAVRPHARRSGAGRYASVPCGRGQATQRNVALFVRAAPVALRELLTFQPSGGSSDRHPGAALRRPAAGLRDPCWLQVRYLAR